MKKIFILVLFLYSLNIYTQEYFPKNDGVKATNTNYFAFKNAKIFVSPDQIIEKGTLLIKAGKVVAVGSNIEIPNNVTEIDLEGKSLYPSFIDVYSDFGVDKPKRPTGSSRTTQYDSNRKGYYWNEHIMSEKNAIDKFKFDATKAEELRKIGFGVVNSHIQDGIVRGTGLLVALNSEKNDAYRILDDSSSQNLSFSKSVLSKQSYPTSLMGAMALLRQLYLDADWYSQGKVPTIDRSIEALNRNKNLPQIFYAGDKLNDLRADKIGDQFGIQYVIVGSGNEYQLVDEIKNTNATFIIPINFPNAYDVENPFQANYVSLGDMRYWNQAPSNPAVLAKNGVSFSFTTHSLKKLSSFKSNVSKAITYGLDANTALEALTTIPAQIVGKSNEIGALKVGMHANFLITSGAIFDPSTVLYENWVQGTKNVINDMNIKDIRGEYKLSVAGKTYAMTISGKTAKPSIKTKMDTITVNSKIQYQDGWIGILLYQKDGTIQMKSKVTVESDNLTGNGTYKGNSISWKAVKKPKSTSDIAKSKDKKIPTVLQVTYPNIGYGYKTKPVQKTFLFKNATVWTNESEGILKNTDVLVKNGKIVKIGSQLNVGNALIIDATNKHLTAGIIDEHTHVAATSSNEAGHNSTAEVSMEDTIDSEDINIYRNLSGGVTSMQILHGSANPIGGRSAIVKLKWGALGEQMIYTDSPKFIKFALGENVKQSNWESYSRFPQTRMGVEQTFVDYFQRAKEYDQLKKSGDPYRIDIEMETIAEILNEERFITCHSYVQSEINMLMKVAEQFDFKINTFTHILEGFKVADKMKKHGVGASTFSDWWAYKYEVRDAIPYNASILHNVGITTAINSDDREMSRRLNQEAGKTVKYGNVSEEDAWKFVTLNPAKLLHIDHRVGSVKVGKDADLVLWNEHPLSIYAKAEKTMIEGAIYFDIENQIQKREAIQKERSTLINMMLKEKQKGAPTQTPTKKEKAELHCDTVEL